MTDTELDMAESVDAIIRAISCLTRVKVRSVDFHIALDILARERDSMVNLLEQEPKSPVD